jgi:hypothetical protein
MVSVTVTTIEKTNFNPASSRPHCMELSPLLIQAELQPAIDLYLTQISCLKLFFSQAINMTTEGDSIIR